MYQAGFSSTLRRMTPGTWVPWYPWPISEVKTWLRSASARSRAMASGSVMASSSSSGLSSRIDAGTAWSSSSSSVDSPRASSMWATSAADGPMWRSANCSALVLTSCSGGSRVGRSSMAPPSRRRLRSPSVAARVRFQSCLAPVVLGA